MLNSIWVSFNKLLYLGVDHANAIPIVIILRLCFYNKILDTHTPPGGKIVYGWPFILALKSLEVFVKIYLHFVRTRLKTSLT